MTGGCTYTQVFKTEGTFGAECSGSQAGRVPEKEKNGINLDLAYCVVMFIR